MREELEALVAEHLDGTLDAAGRERLARELELDPPARAEFGDQLQVHHRLGVALEQADAFSGSVVREVRLLGDSERFSRGVVNRIKRKSRIRVWEVAAAAMILGLLGVLLLRQESDLEKVGAAVPPQVLLVVGHLPLDLGDLRVKERLEALRCRVTTKIAREVHASDATGKALVALSSTSLARDVVEVSGDLTTKFRDSAVPLLVWEPRLFYDLGMIPAAVNHKDWGALKDQSRLLIATPGHPLAAGFSGRVDVTSSPSQYSWGRPRADAIKVATLEGNPDHAAIFAYEGGAAMPGRVAPARRAGFFLFDTTALQLTPQGWALFDAAVRWCVQP